MQPDAVPGLREPLPRPLGRNPRIPMRRPRVRWPAPRPGRGAGGARMAGGVNGSVGLARAREGAGARVRARDLELVGEDAPQEGRAAAGRLPRGANQAALRAGARSDGYGQAARSENIGAGLCGCRCARVLDLMARQSRQLVQERGVGVAIVLEVVIVYLRVGAPGF